MPPILVLLPSPLLGPAVWRPVAEVLGRRGYRTLVPALPADVATPDGVLGALAAALPADGDVVLVPHSNAGAYVPGLVARRRVAGTVFVDAILPPPSGEIPLAPPEFLAFLREKAGGDGLLPPWTQWWEGAELTGLFPDAATRDEVEREQRRLPLSYFEGTLDVPRGWDGRPAAYLAFGETYAAEQEDAKRRGLPVRAVPGDHLHMLHDPDGVTGALEALLGEIGVTIPATPT